VDQVRAVNEQGRRQGGEFMQEKKRDSSTRIGKNVTRLPFFRAEGKNETIKKGKIPPGERKGRHIPGVKNEFRRESHTQKAQIRRRRSDPGKGRYSRRGTGKTGMCKKNVGRGLSRAQTPPLRV